MDYVRQILGEAEEPDDEKKETGKEKGKSEPKSEPKAPSKEAPAAEEADTEITELANLWNTGNKDDLLRRFMEMDNETAVKVVFAIGREGAIELARMADQEPVVGAEDELAGQETGGDYPVGAMLGREGAEAPLEAQASTEPASVEPPEREGTNLYSAGV
jgi:hypothetical protein